MCALHQVGSSPYVLWDGFWAASQGDMETAMGFIIRMEALAKPLIGLEGSGLATLKDALVEVVGRLANKATKARLHKCIRLGDVVCFSSLRAALNRVVEKHGDPATEAKAARPRGRPPKESKDSGGPQELVPSQPPRRNPDRASKATSVDSLRNATSQERKPKVGNQSQVLRKW
jgi:hypothetical protein